MILSKIYIKQVVQEYFKDKPVKKVYLFGSYARDEADVNSDLDLLVDLDYTKYIGWQFYNWHNELADILKRKVDVISSKGLSKFIAPFIDADKSLIYAK